MSRATERTLLIAGSLLFGFLFSYPMLRYLGAKTQVLDWSRGLEWAWADWITITRFHQVPLWNPYKCGGMPDLANPQSRVVTPFLLLHLLFGPYAGLELEIPFHLAIAFGGAYILGRVAGCGRTAALACGVTFAGSSWFPLHAAAGHDVFFPATYLPLVGALSWESFQTRRLLYAALAGLVLALILGEGGVYFVIQGAILVGVITFVATLTRRSLWPTLVLFVVAVFSLGFAAIKLGPAVQLMTARPRTGYLEWVGPYDTLVAIFSRQQNFDGPFGRGGFWEFAGYISPPLAVLAVIGTIFSLRKALPWLAAAATFFVIAIGGVSQYSPFALLHRLPFITATYAPSRYLISFVLCVAVLAAIGADALISRFRKVRYVAYALILIGFFDVLLICPPPLREPFIQGTFPAVTASRQFRQYRDATPYTIGMLPLNLANLGAVNCWETNFLDFSNPHVVGENQPGYKGEQYLLGAGSVKLTAWTPNALTYDVSCPAPTTLVINQSYDVGWKLAQGSGVIVSQDDLLGVHIPAGTQHLKVIYRSPYFVLGTIISLATFCSLLGLWFWEAKGASKRKGSRESS